MTRLAKLGIIVAAAALSVSAQNAINITTITLPPATIGLPYPNVTLQTTGDPGPMSWNIDAPSNWTVGPATATTGVFCYKACGGFSVQEPPGQYSLTIGVNSPSGSGSRSYTLVVQNQLQIGTTFLPNANANQAYLTQMQAAGGSGNFLWSIQSGTLPPGITLTDSVKGVLSGTAPGVNGVYPFTVQLKDQTTQATVTQALSITIVNGIAILTTALPNAIVNQPYSIQLQGAGANLVWSLVPGSVLPPNLTLAPNGVLSGAVIATGSFSVPVKLVNSQFPNAADTRIFTLLVTLGPLGIVEQTLPSATQNVPYSAALTPTGGIPPYVWSLDVSSPKALSIDPSSGIISGTFTTSGSFPVTVTLRDSIGATVSHTYPLAVGNAVSVTTSSLPNGSPNVAYSATLTAAGGSIPYHWSVITGSLPPGLALNATTGQISGTPTAAGAVQFTVQVTDFLGGTATKVLTIAIGTSQSVTISATDFTASVGVAVSQTVTAAGGVAPYTFSVSAGSLPGGLQLGGSTGVITGTPNATGTFPVTLKVTDANQATATVAITITVKLLSVSIVIPANPGSGQQPGIGVSLSDPAPSTINGTLTLTFLSSVGGDDQMVRFVNGSRSVPFSIPQGQTAAPNTPIVTGTVAGTITLTASVSGAPDVIKTIVIDSAVPVITSVALSQVTGGLNVVATGYSNTREISSGTFSFTVASGSTLTQAQITVPLGSAFTAWFNNSASSATGGQFKLTVPFSVTQGSASAITKVSVSLTNTKGVSVAVSSP
jgi:hypothetical protein